MRKSTVSANEERDRSISNNTSTFAQIRATIVSSYQAIGDDDGRYIVYVLEVEDFINGKFWKVDRRYNQFRDFHMKIVEKFGPIFEFPGKKLLNRFSTQFIDKRAKELQEYLDNIMNYQNVVESKDLKLFLDPQNNVTPVVSSQMWSHPQKTGWLTKQGHIMKTWRQRWFILQDNVLFYFKTVPTPKETNNQPKGVITLGFCTVEPVVVPNRSFCFEIKHSHSDSKDFTIQASSEEELKSWVSTLRAAKVKYTRSFSVLDDEIPTALEQMAEQESDKMSTSSRSLRNYVSQRISLKPSTNLQFNVVTYSNTKGDYFVDSDTDDNIRYTVVNGRKTVKGGTLNKLIEKLTDAKATDINYIRAFLLTYRSFTDPHFLLTNLINIFVFYIDVKPDRPDDKDSSTAVHSIQLRVSIVIRQWLNVHFYDFVEDNELTDKLLEFNEKYLRGSTNSHLQKIGATVKLAIRKKITPEVVDEEMFLLEAPLPILPSYFDKNFDLIDISSIEVARQLSIIEFKLLKKIEPKEFLNQNWNKPEREVVAPNIVAIQRRFNKTSYWASTRIVKYKELKTRVVMVTRLIEIANECKRLGNFNSAVAILAGLHNSAIHRLKKTWEGLSSEIISLHENLRDQLMNSEKSYKKYRDSLLSVDGPCVPYLGVMMSDLTFIEDGNTDLLKDTNLINFEKRAMISNVIMDIQQFQQLEYCLRPIPILQNYLTNLDCLTESELYEKSLINEPRDC